MIAILVAAVIVLPICATVYASIVHCNRTKIETDSWVLRHREEMARRETEQIRLLTSYERH